MTATYAGEGARPTGSSLDMILANIETAKRRFTERTAKMRDIRAIREGRFEDVAPGLFPPDIPEPMVANFIDVAAQSTAEAIAPLPSFSCTNPQMNTDAARRSADKRTKIANYYVQYSRLGEHHVTLADRLNTYGFCAYVVEPDFEDKVPCIYIEDSIDALYVNNRKGETIWYARRFRRSLKELKWEFSDYYETFTELQEHGQTDIEVVRYYDKDQQTLLVPQIKAVLLREDNPLSKCAVRVVERPRLGDVPRGAYDDLVWVQLARAMMAQYTLRIADQIANAPTTMPMDVQDYETGPDAIIRTDQGDKVRRVDLSVSQHPFVELQNLANELRIGSRHPEGRDGDMDASIITGKGVQALMAGFDQRIKTLQGKIASALTDVIAMCFEMDQALWPNRIKSVMGLQDGAPFEMKYKPSRDIDGNFTSNVSYGLTAGLDPNRSLVFILQAEMAGLISKDTSRRQLPFDLNAEAERDRILVEQMRDALLAGVAGLPQTLPAMAMQGGDPTVLVSKIGALIKDLQKGTSIEDAVVAAFAPPPPQQPSPEELAAAGGAESPEAALGPGGPGQDLSGGVAGAQAQQQGPVDDLLMALAGTGPSGNPNLSFQASRREPL